MSAPFQPGEVVECLDASPIPGGAWSNLAEGRLYRVTKCIRNDQGEYGVLIRGVLCNATYGFWPDRFRKIAGLGRNGFDFREMMGAKA